MKKVKWYFDAVTKVEMGLGILFEIVWSARNDDNPLGRSWSQTEFEYESGNNVQKNKRDETLTNERAIRVNGFLRNSLRSDKVCELIWVYTKKQHFPDENISSKLQLWMRFQRTFLSNRKINVRELYWVWNDFLTFKIGWKIKYGLEFVYKKICGCADLDAWPFDLDQSIMSGEK